jgi:hypothetical protein
LFINDLPQALQEAKVVLFADDTNILLTDSKPLSLNEKIQNVKEQLDNWFHENQLIINTEKTNALFFQGKRPNPIHTPVFSLNRKGSKLFFKCKIFRYLYNLKPMLGHPHPTCLSKI